MASSIRIQIDLPFPVSVNRIWRAGNKKVFKSPSYLAWEKDAWVQWLIQRPALEYHKIVGHYSLHVLFHEQNKRHRDIGNLEKVLSDFAQHVGIVENDSLCRRLTLEYGDAESAPLGARLTFEPMP